MDTSMMDALFLFAGAYLLYSSIKMKIKGEISKQLISKKVNLDTARDVEGYKKAIFPVNIIFAAILIISAILGIVDYNYSLPVWVNIAVYVSYIAGIIFYAIMTVKIQTKYLL